MLVDFPIISTIKRVKYRHSIRAAVGQGWSCNIVYICAHTIVDISLLLNGTQWAFTVYWLWHCTSARWLTLSAHTKNFSHHRQRQRSRTNIFTHIFHTLTHTDSVHINKKCKRSLALGVIQFLSLTAPSDRKINLATKLIYLFFITLLCCSPPPRGRLDSHIRPIDTHFYNPV